MKVCGHWAGYELCYCCPSVPYLLFGNFISHERLSAVCCLGHYTTLHFTLTATFYHLLARAWARCCLGCSTGASHGNSEDRSPADTQSSTKAAITAFYLEREHMESHHDVGRILWGSLLNCIQNKLSPHDVFNCLLFLMVESTCG